VPFSHSLLPIRVNIFKVGLIVFLAGLAPDLDVFIGSSTDPILFLEFHRQFTHSLIFIPFGSLIVSLLVFPLVKRSMSFKNVYIASLLGYATHGLLDACTSYGTLLFWPFSNERITWNNISIIDPLFTIPVLLLAATAIKTKKKVFSFFAIGWIAFYLSLGFVQYERALSTANELANSRGHNAERLTLKPSFGNLILWKSIYQHNDTFYVDAIRTVQLSTWCVGESIRAFDYEQHLPDLDEDSQQKKDIERFRWFSQDYLGYDEEKNIVTDVRYSMIPNQIDPMWGLGN
jgi:Predicted membrane-bound metal-dependent hydrolases